MQPMSQDEFDDLVSDALDQLPDGILELLDNVVILTDDENGEEDLLGLYEGVPRTERMDYGGLELPDRITLYRLALCGHCDDLADLKDEILVTVVHELAHHLGIDDERLTELGWD
jgi:predicted Zn-dependent protease with MMP-like domain